jgi:hypothetical protein
LFIQDQLLYNSQVVALFSLRSMLEAKAFLLSPAELGILISIKHTKGKALACSQGFFFGSKTRALHSFFSRGRSCSGQGRSWKTGSQVTCSAGWK